MAVALAAWAPVLGGGFRFDDYGNVVHDPATRDGAALLDRLPRGVRPLTRISYFLDHAAAGFSPRGFLATNLALHLAASWLLFALARRRLDSVAAGVLAGALFAAQPASDAVVAYVSGRSALLSAVLLLAGLLVWDQEGQRGPRAGWAATGLFALACLARETALVFPLLVLLWEATRRAAGEPLRRRLAPLLPAAAVTIAALLLAFAASSRYRSLAATSLALHDPLRALAENLRALPVALSLWVRPGALAIEHPGPPVGALWIAAGAVLALGLAAVALAARRRAPNLALAAGWVVVALLPTHTLLARRGGHPAPALPRLGRPRAARWRGGPGARPPRAAGAAGDRRGRTRSRRGFGGARTGASVDRRGGALARGRRPRPGLAAGLEQPGRRLPRHARLPPRASGVPRGAGSRSPLRQRPRRSGRPRAGRPDHRGGGETP